MKRTDWIAGLAVLGMLLLITWLLLPPRAINFEGLDDACATIAARGFHCASDCADGRIDAGFLVSREETTPESVNQLCKAGPMGPEWKGKVWIRSYSPERVWTMPDDAHARIWGHVCVFGDGEFLAELEGTLQSVPM